MSVTQAGNEQKSGAPRGRTFDLIMLALIVLAVVSVFLIPPYHPRPAPPESGTLEHGSPWLYVGMSILDIAFLVIVGLLCTRRLSKIPSAFQNLLEALIGGLEDFFVGMIGPGSERHLPFLVTLFLYILTMNLMGNIPGLKPPTSTLNMTVALALVTIIYVQAEGIRANGFKGYFMHFMGEPLWLFPLMLPLHIIGEIAKPISLAIRLFGNIFGEETVVLQLALLGPLVIGGYKLLPLEFPMMVFGLFTSVVQALVFAVLAAAYIVLIAGEHAGAEHERADHEPDHGALVQSPA